MSPMDEVTKVELRELGRRIKSLEEAMPQKADLMDLNALTEEVRVLRKTLVTFAFTIAGSAIVFALTVFQILNA